MASLENRTGNYNVVFRFGGKKYTRSLHTGDDAQADRLLANLEQTIRDVKTGRITLPDGADIPTFLMSDGKLSNPHVVEDDTERPPPLELRELFDLFFESLPQDSLEETTISQMMTHRSNILRILGYDFSATDVDLSCFDTYSRRRSKEPGRRGRKIGANTIKKELVTFRRLLRWAQKRDIIALEIPELKDVHFPKSTELPPFQTYDEISTQINAGDLSDDEQRDLWDCLYLRRNEIDELLQHVHNNARETFLFPMVVAAAHTGARRSELMRSEISDIRDDVLIVREKKRRRGKLTTRRVPMSPLLQETMAEWVDTHPGGKYTFAMGRTEGLPSQEPLQLTRDEAHYHFRSVLSSSKWNVISGWHCLRHSFISNLASNSVDQRLIDEFVGHTTEDMRRRYRHLFPDVKQAAILSVFD